MRHTRSTISLLVTVALFGATYIASHLFLFNSTYHHELTRQRKSLDWHLPDFLIKIAAGEFKGLVADFIVMDIGASLGDPNTTDEEINWNNIARQFNTAMMLDPYFQQTYVLAQGLLPWRGNKVEATMQLLEISKNHRTWDWRPAYCLGFNTYYFLKDYGTAGKILLEAGKSPNAPYFLAILGSRLATRGGETETAIMLLESMLRQRLPNDPEFPLIQQRLEALYGVLSLERALIAYENKFKNKTRSLDDLVRKGLLDKLPTNPYGEDYCLDSHGDIHFDKVSCSRQTD